MMLANAVLTALAVAIPPDSLLSADSLLIEMRKGGYTMIWRHTATDRSVQEPMGYQNLPRFQQRNLNDRGIADAKLVGAIFKAREIPVGDVLSSPMFRTRETAEYAFGRVEATPLLRQLEPSPEQRKLLAAEPAAGTNRVLVTHHFIIERNVPGITPGRIAEGEAVVVRPAGGDAVRLIGIFKMADWERLGGQIASAPSPSRAGHGAGLTIAHGGPIPGATSPAATNLQLVIPPSLETPQHAAVAEYLRIFNAGDSARMRRFYERSVVPNPERTTEQRMEVYDRLKRDLGSLSIDSVDSVEAGRVVLTARTGASVSATITFGVEPQAPYRLTTISFQIGGR